MICGAIDLGGTKIEGRLFDANMETVLTRRIPTPVSDFDAFIDGLSAQIEWLTETAGNPNLPVGISLPGWIDPATGHGFASNIPITGRDVGAALQKRFGRSFPLMNDCMAFAYSEAHGGAAEGSEAMIGLIVGTGMGAGVVINGEIPPRYNGLALEIGHTGMPARILSEQSLPLIPCGCGKTGCMERYVSGTGLAAISQIKLNETISNQELTLRASNGDANAEKVLDDWADLMAESLLTMQLVVDPDCFVLGGGLSNMDGVTERVSKAFEKRKLGPTRIPAIRTARFGDSSGARGVALYALNKSGESQ
ncbi:MULTISPECIES: ROK family protein [Ochrobactrum]|uniref:ROK family protein n=1 Tax=Ochrobactrum chromiisoli TaxID=2993941 RepID=A0ABT3QRN5_9HYPH|nr:ROK family protein [Ochrobactrum chromiisoli]MCX2698250.1 ROK family protein [Ochrobactrum chromiisoli]